MCVRGEEVFAGPLWGGAWEFGVQDLPRRCPPVTASGCCIVGFQKSLALQHLCSTDPSVLSVYHAICTPPPPLFFMRTEASACSPNPRSPPQTGVPWKIVLWSSVPGGLLPRWPPGLCSVRGPAFLYGEHNRRCSLTSLGKWSFPRHLWQSRLLGNESHRTLRERDFTTVLESMVLAGLWLRGKTEPLTA